MVAGVHANALQEIPEANLIGVWSHTPARTQQFAERYHIHGYQSFEELLKNPNILVVILCLPSGYHGEYGKRAAAFGKHVVVEKPIEITVAGARDLIKSCQTNDVKLSVIFQHRFTPAAQKIRQAIDQGLLGKLVLGDAYVKWYRSPEYYESNPWRGTKSIDGGGALMMQAIHTIDLLQWIMGGIKNVTGFIKTSIHKIEVEALGVAAVEYLSGAVGVIEGATAIHPSFKERIEIHGERGSIKTQLQEIIAAIQENREPLVNGEEGLKSVQIVLGIYESSEKKQRVELRSADRDSS